MQQTKLRAALVASALSLLVSCGGGGSSSSSTATAVDDRPTAAQASRLLAQASFGASMSEIEHLTASGYNAWLDEQFAKPQTMHLDYIESIAGQRAKNQDYFFQSFWRQAALGEDQLRQRVTFALSQIFVVSFQANILDVSPRGVASYYDTLATHAFGNYRELLEAVTRHPMMGAYLSSLRNQKESGERVPDENYAREVMQLFSIGLYELNPDGSLRNNKQETYTSDDIRGLAKVFTGWSWAGQDKSFTRFLGGDPDPNRDWQSMQSYPEFHSSAEKKFLNTTIPAFTNAEDSLKIALDTLFNHSNVGPFIGRQLIQRLVTSNPSPQYVKRVAAVFADNGKGVRGDMKAVIRAVLLDPEARTDVDLSNPNIGKLREPVLRLANWMRAFNVRSASNSFLISRLDSPTYMLGQTPMRSPSVFNFYRPGYVPPNTSIASAGLVAPEMQITDETSVAGYLNFMRDTISKGIPSDSPDVKSDYTTELSLADTPEALVDRVNLLLMANQMSEMLRSQILNAINSVVISTTDVNSAATARQNRVRLAVFLTMASPEYFVQK